MAGCRSAAHAVARESTVGYRGAIVGDPNHLARASEVGHRHNGLRFSASVTPRIGPFEVGINNAVRPYEVVNAADFIDATRDAITDPYLRKLIQVGAIDQLTHADDAVVTHTDWPAHIIDGYQREMDTHT